MYDVWKDSAGDFYVLPAGGYILADYSGKGNPCIRLWLENHTNEDGEPIVLDVTKGALLGIAHDMRAAYVLLEVCKRGPTCEPSSSSPSPGSEPSASQPPSDLNRAMTTLQTIVTTARTPLPSDDI